MPVNNSSILKLNGVSFTYRRRNGLLSYKKHTALNSIDFEIFNGETVGILGRNGAGKSTLLQLIAGILVPSSGSIISNKNLSISLLKLRLGFTPILNGRENAIMSAMLLGHTKEEAVNRLDAIIAFSGLNKWIDEPVGTYSTGMKARLGFAVALQLSPDILLVDEVLGVGDEVFKRKSVKAMKSKIGSKSQTVVLVSHSIPTLRELCDRIAWIDDGKIKATGEPNEIIALYMKNL